MTTKKYPLEKKVQEWCMEHIKKHWIGAFVFKAHQTRYSQAGIPDLIICYQGVFAAIEVKTEKGKLSKIQAVTIEDIKNALGFALVLYGIDQKAMDDFKRSIDERDKTL